MEQMVINAKTRTVKGKKAAYKLRSSGRLPAVVYNSKGESRMLDVDEVEFNKIWRNITPTTLITLSVDGKLCDVLIKDTEYDIKTDKVLHADFFEPADDKKLTARMVVHYSGTPAGVLKGGFLVKRAPDVVIKACAKHLPAKLVIDISKINIGESFCVKDIDFDKNVTVITPAETQLVSVVQPH